VASHSYYSSTAYLASASAVAFALAFASVAAFAFEGQLSSFVSTCVIEEVLAMAFSAETLAYSWQSRLLMSEPGSPHDSLSSSHSTDPSSSSRKSS